MNTVQDNVLQDRLEALLAENQSNGGISSIVAGTNITVDNSDPANPIVSSTGGGGISPEAAAFLNSPSANSFSTFLGSNEITGSGSVVRGVDPSITFGTTAGRLLMTTTNGLVATTTPTDTATANTVVRRNNQGGFNFSGAISSNTPNASVLLTGANSNLTVNGFITLSNGTYSVRFITPNLNSNVDLTLANTTGTILTGSPNAVTFLNTPNSENLRNLLTDETGTEKAVFSRTPVLENPTVTDFVETEVNIGNMSGNISLTLNGGTKLRGMLTGNCTVNMPSASASKSFCILLTSQGFANYAVTFNGVKWADGAAPTKSINADLYAFTSFNGVWYGTVIGNMQ